MQDGRTKRVANTRLRPLERAMHPASVRCHMSLSQHPTDSLLMINSALEWAKVTRDATGYSGDSSFNDPGVF